MPTLISDMQYVGYVNVTHYKLWLWDLWVGYAWDMLGIWRSQLRCVWDMLIFRYAALDEFQIHHPAIATYNFMKGSVGASMTQKNMCRAKAATKDNGF